MPVVALLLASLYVLPGESPPAPDPAQAARVAGALEELRTGEGVDLDAAVRELALVGAPALPAVVARLNEAPPHERLMLLSAMRRVEQAAPLFGQARDDPSPAIRAWLAVPPRDDPDLAQLARRYLDLLALVDPDKSEAARRDLDPFGERWTPPSTIEGLRDRLKDQRFAAEARWRRSTAAHAFARRGARALREGALRCDPADPLFQAYLVLLEEEKSGAFYFALTALVGQGEALAPVLEQRLRDKGRDPSKLLRILMAVRPDRARPLFDDRAAWLPEVQRAMVELSSELYEGEAHARWLEQAALADDMHVRQTALDALLDLDPPAGLEPARRLFDPETAAATDFSRAAMLLARVGEIDVLVEYATVRPPVESSETAGQLRLAHRAAQAALKAYPCAATQEFGLALLGSESAELRLLGLDLVQDVDRLLEFARDEPEDRLAQQAVTRALEAGGEGTGLRVVETMAARGLDVPWTAMTLLAGRGEVDALLVLARSDDDTQSRRALHRLAQMPVIDPVHEPALAALAEGAPEELRDEVLAAELPLGTERVRARLEEDPEVALEVLRARAQGTLPIPFAWPLMDRVEGAGPEELEDLCLIVQSLREVEPGLYHALFHAWEKHAPTDLADENVDRGPLEQQEMVLEGLARSRDVQSAQLLLDELVAEARPNPAHLFGVLKAAARLLDAQQLAALAPAVRAQVAGAYAAPDERPPPWDPVRARLLAGGLHALAWKQVPAGLALCCDIVLDERLQPSAYEFKGTSPVPGWALEALRSWDEADVDAAFRASLARAEEEGRLARMHPDWLYAIVQQTQEGRDRGRALSEVGLALCEVLERLPFDGDVGYERMRALGGLRRYVEAADAAQADAVRKRALGLFPEDDYWSPERLEGRARLYRDLAGGDPAGFDWLADEAVVDPLLHHVGAWYLYWYVPDLERAARFAERAVRRSAGLYHPYRDMLAAVRVRQGRPVDALYWLDPRQRLPVDRPEGNRWNLYFQAEAHLQQGRLEEARRDLELALMEDRRLLPTALTNPAFDPVRDVFRQVDNDYLDRLFSSAFFE